MRVVRHLLVVLFAASLALIGMPVAQAAPPSLSPDATTVLADHDATLNVAANDALSGAGDSFEVTTLDPTYEGSIYFGDPLNGTLTISPSRLASGTYSFEYTVTNDAAESDTTTVTLHVTAQAAPVAVDDATSGYVGSTVTYNVLANDLHLLATDQVSTDDFNSYVDQDNNLVWDNPDAVAGTVVVPYTVKLPQRRSVQRRTPQHHASEPQRRHPRRHCHGPGGRCAGDDQPPRQRHGRPADGHRGGAGLPSVRLRRQRRDRLDQARLHRVPGLQRHRPLHLRDLRLRLQDPGQPGHRQRHHHPAPAVLANNDEAFAAPGVATTVEVRANDHWQTSVTITGTSTPAHGTVTIDSGSVVYTSNVGYPGIDTFTYTITQPTGEHGTATVTMHVEPPPVENLNVDPLNGGARLTWVNPTPPGFSGAVVRYIEGDTAPASPTEGTGVPVGPNAQTVDVTGLVNGHSYTFAVFAKYGTSTYSRSAEGTVVPSIPPVQNLQVAVQDGGVVLSWDNPPGVTGITVSYSTDTAPSTPDEGTSVPVAGTPSSVTVSGLTNGTTYYFSVFTKVGPDPSPARSVSAKPFSCPNLASALDAGSLVTSQSWVLCSSGDANDGANTLVTPLHRVGGTQALMTSGSAANAEPPNDSSSTTAGNGSGTRGAYDVSIYKMALNVPGGSNCLAFDMSFGSEEYPEYVGSAFNDGFIAELDTNDWNVVGSTISAPHNFAKDANGGFMSVNSPIFANPANVVLPPANGTEYDGMTPNLTATTTVTPGTHTLYLSIFDAGDAALDTGVFFDNLRTYAAAAGTCSSGLNQAPHAVADSLSAVTAVAKSVDVKANDTDPDGDALTVSGGEPDHGTRVGVVHGGGGLHLHLERGLHGSGQLHLHALGRTRGYGHRHGVGDGVRAGEPGAARGGGQSLGGDGGGQVGGREGERHGPGRGRVDGERGRARPRHTGRCRARRRGSAPTPRTRVTRVRTASPTRSRTDTATPTPARCR